MLFNSYAFIFAYFPATLCLFFFLGNKSPRIASLWLTIASFIFYGWWSQKYVLLLFISIIINYVVGMKLAEAYADGRADKNKTILMCAVSANILLLVYYKYMNFFVLNFNKAFGCEYQFPEIILPIGISFFTFTQIAFLVDASRGLAKEYNFIHYCLFVTYFPHLIAGPILHHKEMMPQFSNPRTYRFNFDNMAIGLTIFIIGLFKKVVLADNVSGYASPVFDAATKGLSVSTFEAWGGALAYTMQLYFDFSGYTDMAIGSSRMLGIKLPINFLSPYKAHNIIEFWRRWHITLSRFLRDYLYIPLGGNRRGKFRRHMNLLATMLLGGLWHGANWTFLIWGGLHGVYLILNHGWQNIRKKFGYHSTDTTLIYQFICHFITFISIVFAWVFFRSTSSDAAIIVIKGMLGMNGTLLPLKWVEDTGSNFIVHWMLSNGIKPALNDNLFTGSNEIWVIALLLCICMFLPNTSDLFCEKNKDGSQLWLWHPNKIWVTLTIIMGVISILCISDMSEFIYFQF